MNASLNSRTCNLAKSDPTQRIWPSRASAAALCNVITPPEKDRRWSAAFSRLVGLSNRLPSNSTSESDPSTRSPGRLAETEAAFAAASACAISAGSASSISASSARSSTSAACAVNDTPAASSIALRDALFEASTMPVPPSFVIWALLPGAYPAPFVRCGAE